MFLPIIISRFLISILLDRQNMLLTRYFDAFSSLGNG